jgi:hypothetical protein
MVFKKFTGSPDERIFFGICRKPFVTRFLKRKPVWRVLQETIMVSPIGFMAAE